MKSTPHPTIMLLEDEPIIALDIERSLSGLFPGQPESFPSSAAALAWLADNTPDAAIIDIVLRDGPCSDVAGILVERGVPFVVHSARRAITDEANDVFRAGKWVSKLSDPSDLIDAVQHCLRSKSAHQRHPACEGEGAAYPS
jgi:DNA-binding response OmpR family regulator